MTEPQDQTLPRSFLMRTGFSSHSIESKLSCRLCLNSLLGSFVFRRLCGLLLFFLGLLGLLCFRLGGLLLMPQGIFGFNLAQH